MTKNNKNKPAAKRTRLRVAGLFAGIGGFEQGLAQAGHETSLLCELDAGASAVLRHRFPRVPLVSDVREIDTLKGIDLLCAGFPCQDLSSIGQKKGIKGSQSSLVDHVFRILEQSSVEWVLIENVRFMLHLRGGEAMKRITTRLEILGYRWAYRVLNSHAFGVPHRRHRVFLLASRHNDPRASMLLDDAAPQSDKKPSLDEPIGFYWTEGTYATGLARNAIPPLKGGSSIGIPSPPAVLLPDGFVGTPDLRDAERLQGFPKNWTVAAEDVCRSSVRWKLVGNAVTVPVARWIGERIAAPGAQYEEAGDARVTSGWLDAGWSLGNGRFAAAVTDWPVVAKQTSLVDYLREPLKPLSLKATDGFLRRANAGKLKFPEGFLNALNLYRSSLI